LETTDGRHQEVEVVANVYDEDGLAVIQCNIRDITVRKLAEDILRRNEALFSALIEQAPVGVYVVDAEWRLRQINSVALPTFAAAHPHIGQSFEEIMAITWPKAVAEQIIARFRHTMETGEPYHVVNFSRQRRDLGVEQSYEWSLQRVTLPAGEYGVVCFFNDITERRLAEENRKRLAVMTASNKKLERSIVKRQAVEDALKSSQQRTNELLETSRLFQEEFRKLSHRLLTAHEEERKRISRELHDVIAQALTGINLRLASLQTNAAGTPDPEELRATIAQTHQMVEQAVETVHRFARDLRPSMLDDLGLIPSLQMYLSGYQQRTNIQARLEADPTVEQLGSEQRTVLYRIAQEALTNVERHAKATQVHLQIQRNATGRLCMVIQDNGHGFEAGGSPTQRLGMLGMRERVEMIGGTFEVLSKLGGPTVIRVEVP
jgi:PAS domain S-box-containing protein